MTHDERLLEFWKELVQWFGEETHSELENWDFTELATKHDLIYWEPYDAVKHGDMDASEGDMIWKSRVS